MKRLHAVVIGAGPAFLLYMLGCAMASVDWSPGVTPGSHAGDPFSPWHPWWLLTVAGVFASTMAFVFHEFPPLKDAATTEEQAILDELRRKR